MNILAFMQDKMNSWHFMFIELHGNRFLLPWLEKWIENNCILKSRIPYTYIRTLYCVFKLTGAISEQAELLSAMNNRNRFSKNNLALGVPSSCSVLHELLSLCFSWDGNSTTPNCTRKHSHHIGESALQIHITVSKESLWNRNTRIYTDEKCIKLVVLYHSESNL